MPKSSTSPIGSLANAKTVFFCVSVGTTLLLSPVRCVSAKSPARATLTLRSLSSWRAPDFMTRTTCVSALPYWLSPRIIGRSRPFICGVAEGAQQQRHVQVPPFEREHDRHRRVERAKARALEVGAGVELEAVLAGLELLVGQRADPAVGVGFGLRDLLPVAVGLMAMER